MSVYTTINQQQLDNFLSFYSIGSAINFRGIKAGVENTNYFVTTTKGEYVLTIFEFITAEGLPFYLDLMQRLSQNNLPVPTPQKSQDGHFFYLLAGKPAALFNRISGKSITHPSALQCTEMGGYLAKLHLISSLNKAVNKASTALTKIHTVFNQIKLELSVQDITLIESEFVFQDKYALIKLPIGIIHADLFKDNVLFEQGHISGILDFYDVCEDSFLLDIAIACNDWCVKDSTTSQDKLESFLAGYSKVRALTGDEREYLPVYLRLAALRFWLSRLSRQLTPKKSDLTLEKNPEEFRQLLQSLR